MCINQRLKIQPSKLLNDDDDGDDDDDDGGIFNSSTRSLFSVKYDNK